MNGMKYPILCCLLLFCLLVTCYFLWGHIIMFVMSCVISSIKKSHFSSFHGLVFFYYQLLFFLHFLSLYWKNTVDCQVFNQLSSHVIYNALGKSSLCHLLPSFFVGLQNTAVECPVTKRSSDWNHENIYIGMLLQHLPSKPKQGQPLPLIHFKA